MVCFAFIINDQASILLGSLLTFKSMAIGPGNYGPNSRPEECSEWLNLTSFIARVTRDDPLYTLFGISALP